MKIIIWMLLGIVFLARCSSTELGNSLNGIDTLDSLKNLPEYSLPQTNQKLVIAHCLTNIIRSQGHEPEDSSNPKYYSSKRNITSSLEGMVQIVPMEDQLLTNASLNEAVEFEICAAIRSGIDSFQFYYILGIDLWGAGALNQLANCVQIIIATIHPKTTMLLDFYHLFRGGNSWSALDYINASRLPVFHINDYPEIPARKQLNDSDHIFPRDGICPFNKLIPKLYYSGFRGAFSIELFNKRYWKTTDAK